MIQYKKNGSGCRMRSQKSRIWALGDLGSDMTLEKPDLGSYPGPDMSPDPFLEKPDLGLDPALEKPGLDLGSE